MGGTLLETGPETEIQEEGKRQRREYEAGREGGISAPGKLSSFFFFLEF